MEGGIGGVGFGRGRRGQEEGRSNRGAARREVGRHGPGSRGRGKRVTLLPCAWAQARYYCSTASGGAVRAHLVMCCASHSGEMRMLMKPGPVRVVGQGGRVAQAEMGAMPNGSVTSRAGQTGSDMNIQATGRNASSRQGHVCVCVVTFAHPQDSFLPPCLSLAGLPAAPPPQLGGSWVRPAAGAATQRHSCGAQSCPLL